ncbi:MAG: DNA-binding protein WhiA [Ruminococcaceae bacterium]|nr:DNA-binding protein WhiA [Oscillospiraceae bacterium]
MSFSSEVKKELCCTLPESACCRRAELAGILALAGTPLAEAEGGGLRLRTENADVAQRAADLLRLLFSKEIHTISADGKNIHTLLLKKEDGFLHIMKSLGFYFDGRIRFCADPFITGESCCRRAFLRGAFLGGGSVSAPQKSYHLEIETHYHGLSGDLLQLFEDESLRARSVMRKSNHVIYIKESEEIADALAALGATDSALELYHIKVEKDMKNRINRQVNCETANLTKTANTAALQIAAIHKVMQSPLREELTPSMLELAELRVQNPEASLLELASLLPEPLSKSAVSRRLQKIVTLAEMLS